MVSRWRTARIGLLVPLLAFGAWTAVTSAQAQQTDAGRPPYTDGDWALLPEWCIDTQDGPYGSPSYSGEGDVGRSKSPRSDRWTGLFGRDFWVMHHYCRALYAERLLLRVGISRNDRVAANNTTIREYIYVIRNCTERMPLMPEVYYRLGVAFLRKGDKPLASEAFAAARKLKPDYWPAYTRWAEELIALRLFDTAEKLVAEGLAHAPDQPQLTALKRRLAARRGQAPGASLPAGVSQQASGIGS